MRQEKQDGVEKEVEGWSIRKSRGRRRNRRILMHFQHQIQGRGQGRPRLMHQRKRNHCCIARILMHQREKCSGCIANISQISMHLSNFITFGEVISNFCIVFRSDFELVAWMEARPRWPGWVLVTCSCITRRLKAKATQGQVGLDNHHKGYRNDHQHYHSASRVPPLGTCHHKYLVVCWKLG